MAGTATHQRSSRQKPCETPLHNHHEIASQVEVNAKNFKYRSNWNTLLGAITIENYLLAVCFVLFSWWGQNFWQKQLRGGMAYICSWFQVFPFAVWGRGLGHGGGKIGDNTWSHSVVKDQEAESTGRTQSRQNLQGATFPLLTCFPHPGHACPFTVPASGSLCFSASLCLFLFSFLLF